MTQEEIAFTQGRASRDEEIAALRQQLATLKNELKLIGEALDDLRVDLTMTMSEVIIELRQQVTLLRNALEMSWSKKYVNGIEAKRLSEEALAATEPNQQQSRNFADQLTDDDFLHMIDESNFAQERE